MDHPGSVVLDPASIRAALRRLEAAGAHVFGADGHRFALNPPLSGSDAAAFERQHGIALPGDYRGFLTGLANGGAGPCYGVFPLGYMNASTGDGVEPWGDSVGRLAEPFALREAWNDLTGYPEDADGPDGNDEAYGRQLDAFYERYWAPSLMNGAIPICHEGCALQIWLVVSGDEAGHLWHDWRADYRGLSPVTLKDGTRATFSAWYLAWLDAALAAAGV